MAKRIQNFFNPLDLEKDIAICVKLPFNKAAGGLFELSYTTEDQAISNLKNLLLTRKGERFMQPLFGSDIYNILFEQNTRDIPEKLKSSLLRDIDFWLPYILIDDIIIKQQLDSEPHASGHGLQIQIKFRVTEQGANRTITLNLSPQGQITIQ